MRRGVLVMPLWLAACPAKTGPSGDAGLGAETGMDSADGSTHGDGDGVGDGDGDGDGEGDGDGDDDEDCEAGAGFLGGPPCGDVCESELPVEACGDVWEPPWGVRLDGNPRIVALTPLPIEMDWACQVVALGMTEEQQREASLTCDTPRGVEAHALQWGAGPFSPQPMAVGMQVDLHFEVIPYEPSHRGAFTVRRRRDDALLLAEVDDLVFEALAPVLGPFDGFAYSTCEYWEEALCENEYCHTDGPLSECAMRHHLLEIGIGEESVSVWEGQVGSVGEFLVGANLARGDDLTLGGVDTQPNEINWFAIRAEEP